MGLDDLGEKFLEIMEQDLRDDYKMDQLSALHQEYKSTDSVENEPEYS